MKKLLLIILVLFLVGCSSNKVKTASNISNFENIALTKGFNLDDGNSGYGNVSYINEHSKVILDDVVIEMIVYSDSDKANIVLEEHIKSFDLLKSTGAQARNDKGKNYQHYSLISNGRYMVSSRIDNTLVFAKVLLKDKELVDSVLNELGY